MTSQTPQTPQTSQTPRSSQSAEPAHVGSQPLLHQKGEEAQRFGTVKLFPIGLSYDARMYSCQELNRVLADTQILHSLYKKAHWTVSGATFYQLHLLLDKHADEQLALVDALAERVQTLGGVAVGDPRHAAELTSIPRPPDGSESVPAMLSRLLEAHEAVLVKAHATAARAAELGDDGTNDLLVSQVVRTGESHAWFLAEHLVDTPLVRV
ncbi:Dps family protein [Kitasatospora sp. NPDC127111]|uniref:Dps family protein n=1 Tax=Kitasatospora sp. NPDC127111 TaxID=3345363 RepID=UPI003638C913